MGTFTISGSKGTTAIISSPTKSSFTISGTLKGAPGKGVPLAGVEDQALVKSSDTDFDTSWQAIANSVAGKTGHVTLAESDVSNLVSDLAAKAPLASPTFTGHVSVPDGTTSTDATSFGQIPSIVDTVVAAITGSAARSAFYSPATYVIAPFGSGYKADMYTTGSASSSTDATAINSVLSTLGAMSPGFKLLFKAGDYYLEESLAPQNNGWICGEGRFATAFHTINNATFGLIDNYNSTSPSSPNRNITFSDFELDGLNQLRTTGSKGINMKDMVYCTFTNLYIHDTTATGLGADDWASGVISGCIVTNCGYNTPVAISSITQSGSTWTVNTVDPIPTSYVAGHAIIMTLNIPVLFNGVYNITSATPGASSFTIGTSNNNSDAGLSLNTTLGSTTTAGQCSDSILGQNGIGIATGALTTESLVITGCFCIGNQDNNILVEQDSTGTGDDAIYIIMGNNSDTAGSVGIRCTGTPNTSIIGNADYRSPKGIFVTSTTVSAGLTVTAVAWSGGIETYTVTSTANVTVGGHIAFSGFSTTDLNGYFFVTAKTSTSVSVAIASNPGTPVTYGAGQVVAHGTSGTVISNNILSDNLWNGIAVAPQSNGVSAHDNTVKNSWNYGMYWGSGYSSITGNRILDSGIDGLRLWTGATEYMPLDHLDFSHNIVLNSSRLQANFDGVSLNSNANTPISNITITNNHLGDKQQTPTQRYGLLIRSGNNANIKVSNNTADGNTSGAILNQDSGNSIWISDNPGTNPIGRALLGNISGTVVFDCRSNSIFYATLVGATTGSFPVTGTGSLAQTIVGTKITLVLTQDATGGRVFTLPGNATASQGGFSQSTAANAVDIYEFTWTGSTWQQSLSTLSVPLPTTNGGTGLSSLGSGVATFLGTPTSAHLAAALTDETGSGSAVFGTSPALTTPGITTGINDANGNPIIKFTPTASAVGGIVITNNISGSTVTVANGNTGNSATLIKGAGTGVVAFRAATDSTNAIALQASGGGAVLGVDSSNSRVAIGGNLPLSTLDVRGPISTPIAAKSSAYTITATDSTILVSGTTTITLPTAVGIAGRKYTIKKTDTGTTSTIATTSSQTIDGVTTLAITTQNVGVTVQSDGANWWVSSQVATTIL